MSYRSRVSQNKDGQSLFNLWKSAKNLPQSQIAKTLQKSLCVRNKAEDLCWMPVVFWPSEDTASLIGMILSLTLLNGPRNTSRKPLSINTIRRAICRCQLKLYHAKRKPYVNMVQKCRHVLWVSKMEKCSMVRWVQIWHSCWKSCPPLKRRETFQRVISFQFKSQHLWWCGVHTCIWYGQPTWFGRHYECWKVYVSLNEKYVKDDHKLFSSWKPISGKYGTKLQHQNSRYSKPRCPDVFNLFWNEEEMLHNGKHAPVPNYFETCSRHQIWNELILCIQLYKFSV